MSNAGDILEGVLCSGGMGRLVLKFELRDNFSLSYVKLSDKLVREFGLCSGDIISFHRLSGDVPIYVGRDVSRVHLLPEELVGVFPVGDRWRDYWNREIEGGRFIFNGYCFRVYRRMGDMSRDMTRTEVELRVGCDVPDTYGFSMLRGVLGVGEEYPIKMMEYENQDWPVSMTCYREKEIEGIICKLEDGLEGILSDFGFHGLVLDEYVILCRNLEKVVYDIGRGYQKLSEIRCLKSKLEGCADIFKRPEWRAAFSTRLFNYPDSVPPRPAVEPYDFKIPQSMIDVNYGFVRIDQDSDNDS